MTPQFSLRENSAVMLRGEWQKLQLRILPENDVGIFS